MTTLSAVAYRDLMLGDDGEYPVIGSDKIWQGAAVGLVAGTGLARPLVGGDKFGGWAIANADNASGSASAINVHTRRKGVVRDLPVSGAVATDVGQPIYAQDDNAFSFNPVGGSFIGRVIRFSAAGLVDVAFDIDNMVDPYGEWAVRETLTGTKTFDAQDCGKAFFVTAAGDGDALTLPAIADGLDDILIVAIDAYGTTQVAIDPNSGDGIRAADLTAVDDKDLLLTKATQRRGDCARIFLGDADGYSASLGNLALNSPSVWTKEA